MLAPSSLASRTRIESLRLRRIEAPLTRPYHLSLGAIPAFQTVLVEAMVDGRCGYGEATYVTGYTDESIGTAWDRARELAATASALRPLAARDALLEHVHDAAFTVTALVTALEMAARDPWLDVAVETRIPILGLLNAGTEPELTAEVDALIARGFSTLKIKVGFDAEADLAKIGRIQRANAGRCRLRIDANQGYSREDGMRFASKLDPDSVELFEQPCAKDDWDGAVAVAAVSTVPMMLDESIYGLADIERAAHCNAARFIKLKLMKMGSLDGLGAGLRAIRALGMTPVLGNGVAHDIGNWMEACVARDAIENAVESNGFLKPRRAYLRAPLRFEAGAIVLEPGYVPELDAEAVAAVTVAEATFAA